MEASRKRRGTRSGDSPEMAARLRAARREGRKYTIIFSVVASGILSIFLARAIEVDQQNAQVGRNRTNCELVQDDRRAYFHDQLNNAQFYQDQVDNVLGNKHTHPPIKAINIDRGPFAKFKPLILSQAKANQKRAQTLRRRARRTKSRIENCTKVFPKHNLL